ncbi:MAG: DUF1576 domain-containing protein [Spirochaetota bacterium]
METPNRLLYLLVLLVFPALAVAGFVAGGIPETIAGVWELQAHPARLLNDFSVVAGAGAALVNATLVALVGIVLVRINGTRLSGPTVAAVFTMFGFGLFGKTPLNILPILLGVFVAARIAGNEFRSYILIALYGTAIGPLVSLVAVELPLPTMLQIPLAALVGIAVGALLPAVAMVMLRLHQGYNLYNIGLTAGFVSLFAAAVVFGGRGQLPGGDLWNESPTLLLQLIVPATAVVLLLTGVVAGGASAFRSFRRILELPGRLPSDFMEMESINGSLINMGVMGLGLWGYVVLVGGDLNGPVNGGLFTVMGFSAFGKHPRNAWPILAGVVLGALVFGLELSAPGVILAALFGTTLAPLAGDFGVIVGVIAGFLHLSIVLRSGAWHAGIDLYNNGFAGGLTATLLVSVIEWYRANSPWNKPSKFGGFNVGAKDKK